MAVLTWSHRRRSVNDPKSAGATIGLMAMDRHSHDAVFSSWAILFGYSL
jgi:hypothetical protein